MTSQLHVEKYPLYKKDKHDNKREKKEKYQVFIKISRIWM